MQNDRVIVELQVSTLPLYNLAIECLGNYPKEMKTYTLALISMAVAFKISKARIQARCLPFGEWHSDNAVLFSGGNKWAMKRHGGSLNSYY